MKASLLIITFNQEKYIREAVVSALNQTYGNLEIIICDDASTDNTWEEIKSALKEYDGPHAVIIQRNAVNLGIVGNFNTGISLTTGELIVAQAGDDISKPERVEKLMDAWLADNCVHDLLYSNFAKFGDFQTVEETTTVPMPVGRWDDEQYGGVVLGAIAAYSKRLFQLHGGIPENARVEDTILSFRANISGGLKYVKENLLLYRIHPQSASASMQHERLMGKTEERWSEILVEAIDRQKIIEKVKPNNYAAIFKARRNVTTFKILASAKKSSRLKLILYLAYLFMTLRFRSIRMLIG